MYINITYKYKCIYIYVIPPPPRHGSTFFVCLGAPPHENGGSLRGGASRWTITISWLGELHPGPIEFVQSGAGLKIEDFLENFPRESSIFNPGPD